MNACHLLVKKSLTDFYGYFESTAPIPIGIEKEMYENYKDQFPNIAKYEYPKESGAKLIRMQALLIGKGPAPAQFILGMDQHGNKIKLRYYCSKYVVGIYPGNEYFSRRNSVWYMSWRMSGEVAELIVSLPMEIRPLYKNPMDEKEIMNRFFDQIVAEAESLMED